MMKNLMKYAKILNLQKFKKATFLETFYFCQNVKICEKKIIVIRLIKILTKYGQSY